MKKKSRLLTRRPGATYLGQYYSGREINEAEARWRRHNEEARKDGCRCGKPGKLVRTCATVGEVPYEIYACDEHRNVETWSSPDGKTWVPYEHIPE